MFIERVKQFFNYNDKSILIIFIAELQKDKQLLQEQLQAKDELINKLIDTNYNEPKKEASNPLISLTPLEQTIYDYITRNNHLKLNLTDLSKQLKLKPNSLKVYFSKIRNKGYFLKTIYK